MKPETPPIQKPGGDIIRDLLERDILALAHLDVAMEIRAVHQAVGRGMFPTTHIEEVRDRRGKRGAPVAFFERMTAAERKLWERNYQP